MFKITLSRQCPYLALVGKQQRLEPAEMNPANPPSTKSLLRHLDGRDDVGVLGLGWEAELLPEDIETPLRERSQPPPGERRQPREPQAGHQAVLQGVSEALDPPLCLGALGHEVGNRERGERVVELPRDLMALEFLGGRPVHIVADKDPVLICAHRSRPLHHDMMGCSGHPAAVGGAQRGRIFIPCLA